MAPSPPVDTPEIDKTVFDIRGNELHVDPVPHVNPLKSLDQLPFHRRDEKSLPRFLSGGTGDDAVEPLADS